MNDLLERPMPGDIIGYLGSGEPIRLAAGASDDDDDNGVGLDLEDGAGADEDDEQDDADDDASDDEDGDSKAKPEKPASKTYTQADVNALLEARDKRLDDTRTQLRRLQARLTKAKTEKKPAAAEGDGEAAAQAIEDAVSAERAKWQREIVHERAEKELIKAGLHIPDGDDGKRMKRLLRTIDYDKVEFEDGEIYGLDDQVDDLKNDYPELFRKPEPESTTDTKTRIRAPKGDAADRKNAPQRPKTTGELYAQQILGR